MSLVAVTGQLWAMLGSLLISSEPPLPFFFLRKIRIFILSNSHSCHETNQRIYVSAEAKSDLCTLTPN